MTLNGRQAQIMEVEPMELIIGVSNSRLGVTKKGIFVLLVTGLLMSGMISLAQAAPPAQSPEEGQVIFQQKCAACHTIGGGPLVGPDLQGVAARRNRDWLTRWISEPEKLLAEGDPLVTELFQEFNNVPMPNMGLTEAEVAAVLAYLETPGSLPVQAPPSAPTGGDFEAGRKLFVGELGLANGGSACISCHNVSQVGALGGGTLGPDLTNVYGRYGEAGLAATLEDLPFPTMQGVFTDKPLTDDEVADLYAYFVQTDQAAAPSVSFDFVWIGLAGFIILGLLGHLLWRKRLTGVRNTLVRAQQRG
jgi:mono/diheme cytochrome c family protein